jgi:hypothetical protein
MLCTKEVVRASGKRAEKRNAPGHCSQRFEHTQKEVGVADELGVGDALTRLAKEEVGFRCFKAN